MKTEHDFVTMELTAPLSELLWWLMGRPGFSLSYPEWEGTFERPDLPEQKITHFKYFGQKFPLSAVYNSTLRDYNPIAKYNHLVEQKISPCVASGLLPLGCVATMTATALGGVWSTLSEEIRINGGNDLLRQQIVSQLKSRENP